MPAIGKIGLMKPAVPCVVRVPLPEAGEGAYVCLLKLPSRDLIELRKLFGREGHTDQLAFTYEVLARTLCDDGGELIYSGREEMEAEFNLPAETLTRLADESMRKSGLAVTEKNSPQTNGTPSP